MLLHLIGKINTPIESCCFLCGHNGPKTWCNIFRQTTPLEDICWKLCCVSGMQPLFWALKRTRSDSLYHPPWDPFRGWECDSDGIAHLPSIRNKPVVTSGKDLPPAWGSELHCRGWSKWSNWKAHKDVSWHRSNGYLSINVCLLMNPLAPGYDGCFLIWGGGQSPPKSERDR